MANPKVSVIVPIYKVEKYLMQCIDSILNQTLKDIEVILVDEGDIDECRAIIDMYEFGPKKDERVRTIHEKNGGYGASVNKGLDIARGEYISIIESDDFIDPKMFEEMYEYAKKLDADVVKTPYYEYWEQTSQFSEKIGLCFWHKWIGNVPENKLFSIKDYPIFMGIHPSVWSCLYKKEYVDKFNIRFLTNKGPYVDHHFKVLSLLNTNKIAWLYKPYYYYRLSNENASASKFNVSVGIKRWNEFHYLMKTEFEGQYSDFAEYNFREEFVNTFGKLFFEGYSISEQDLELLRENLECTTCEQIKNSKNLKKCEILRVLLVKKWPKLLKKYLREHKKENTATLFNIPVLTARRDTRNKYILNLFGILPFAKIKMYRGKVKIIYLFGLIPVIKWVAA